jgi:CheY-like chemotaxis protein
MSPRILVVEDNPITRKLLRVTLQSAGYAVSEAADGAAAVARAAEAMPDLVLLDLLLPDLEGDAVLRRLRALPGGDGLPVLALSGFLPGQE